jgi:hypothetical protein
VEAVSDLVEFIVARLDEDEQAARAVAWTERAASWHVAVGGIASGLGLVMRHIDIIAEQRRDHLEHIARHDPARALRRVEVDRRILREHLLQPVGPAYGCETCHHDREYGIGPYGDCDTLKALASAWADHPGYRAEWKPQP